MLQAFRHLSLIVLVAAAPEVAATSTGSKQGFSLLSRLRSQSGSSQSSWLPWHRKSEKEARGEAMLAQLRRTYDDAEDPMDERLAAFASIDGEDTPNELLSRTLSGSADNDDYLGGFESPRRKSDAGEDA